MKESVSISLVIRGFDEDPNEVTKRTGLKPHDTWLAGKPMLWGGEPMFPNSERLYKENGWVLKIVSGRSLENTNFEDVLADVVDRLMPYAKGLAEYADRGLVWLDGTRYLKSRANSAFYAPGPLLKRLGQLGITFRVDYINMEAFPEMAPYWDNDDDEEEVGDDDGEEELA